MTPVEAGRQPVGVGVRRRWSGRKRSARVPLGWAAPALVDVGVRSCCTAGSCAADKSAATRSVSLILARDAIVREAGGHPSHSKRGRTTRRMLGDPPQDCLDAFLELGDVEGFRHEVVGAEA